MKKLSFIMLFLFTGCLSFSQGPVITEWLQNRTGIKGRHYVSGNSTPINDNDSANVLAVSYSNNWVYVRTNGVPAYITGPFLDGNPSITTSQNAIFKFTLNPTQNTGTLTNTTGGNIGLFINGVALFDYRDGVSWRNSTNSLAGGPLGGMGDGVWNRDAVVAERIGFDCAKGHPAMGNYHHHQNPSAFNLDLNVISTVCSIYAADGLYLIDSTVHSPLIGFAYDGFPIYGAYAYKNADGTGGIVRMKSSYTLRNISTRTTYANGSSVTAGPAVSSTYPLGLFREDYQYNTTSAATPDYLDEHNGRFCVTPEYPNGIYCYFATVDAKWNSAYPYVVGPTFYGVKNAVKVNAITESVTPYIQGATVSPSVSSLNCAGANFSSLAYVNTPYSGTATVSYAGGNGVAYTSGVAVVSTGVTGLTATLQAGTLINGSGNLTYVISGTPSASGTATFPISFGGQVCNLSLVVNNNTPQNPVVNGLACASATFSPAFAVINVNYAGSISIPYTGGNGVAFASGANISSTGVTGLVAVLQAGTLASGNGNLTYTVTGTPVSTGTATFTIGFGGQSCNVNLNVTAPSSSDIFDFTVQPNPVADNILKVQFLSPSTIASNYWIYDELGKLMMSSSQPNLSAGINIATFPKGTYILKIMDQASKAVLSKKFIKGK